MRAPGSDVVTWRNARSVRVRTVELRVTNDVAAWLAAIDVDVVGLLLARREVLLARKLRRADAVACVEATLRRIVTRCGRPTPTHYELSPKLATLLALAFALIT